MIAAALQPSRAGVAELVDARDSKSRFLLEVSVRFRPPAPFLDVLSQHQAAGYDPNSCGKAVKSNQKSLKLIK